MKLLHNILRGSTLATALFIFQACYGMPQDRSEQFIYEARIKVTDAKGQALEGVKCSVKNYYMSEFTEQDVTGADGMLNISVAVPGQVAIRYVDLRFEAEGFNVKDTTINDVTSPEPDFSVKLEPSR